MRSRFEIYDERERAAGAADCAPGCGATTASRIGIGLHGISGCRWDAHAAQMPNIDTAWARGPGDSPSKESIDTDLLFVPSSTNSPRSSVRDSKTPRATNRCRVIPTGARVFLAADGVLPSNEGVAIFLARATARRTPWADAGPGSFLAWCGYGIDLQGGTTPNWSSDDRIMGCSVSRNASSIDAADRSEVVTRAAARRPRRNGRRQARSASALSLRRVPPNWEEVAIERRRHGDRSGRDVANRSRPHGGCARHEEMAWTPGKGPGDDVHTTTWNGASKSHDIVDGKPSRR
jgi:hypothetical protein